MEKEEIEFILFVENIILYIENIQDFIKFLLRLISNFSVVMVYKIYIKVSFVFIFRRYEIRKIIFFVNINFLKFIGNEFN